LELDVRLIDGNRAGVPISLYVRVVACFGEEWFSSDKETALLLDHQRALLGWIVMCSIPVSPRIGHVLPIGCISADRQAQGDGQCRS
jgi:hypothetical protein